MPSIDQFQGRAATKGAPYDNALTVTPSDTEDLPVIPSALFLPLVTDGSDLLQNNAETHQLRLLMQNGEVADIITAGRDGVRTILLELRPRRILATGTSAIAVTLLW
jgi:hypothetical protein